MRILPRPVPIRRECDGAVIVPLSGRNGSGLHVVIDAADVGLVVPHRWFLSTPGYPARGVFENGRTRIVYLHRTLLGLPPGDGRWGDHISGDKLDNRRSNLRAVTPAENAQNRRDGAGASPHRGVGRRSNGRWRAYVEFRGVRKNLGTFGSESEAAAVAARWRAEHMPFSPEALTCAR